MEATTMDDIKIKDGVITRAGKQIGTAMYELKHGYHPAVLVKVGAKREWFEQDEKNLVQKIIDWVKSVI